MKCHCKFCRLSTVFHLLVLLAAQHGETLVVVAISETAYIVCIFFREFEKETVLLSSKRRLELFSYYPILS